MRKRITAVILALIVITTTTYCRPIKAYALMTSSAGIYEAMMLLLALGGLKVDQVEAIESNTVNLQPLETDIKNYSLDLYYWLLDTSQRIASGSNIVGIDSEKLSQLREWEASKGLNVQDNRYMIGSYNFNINTLLVSRTNYDLHFSTGATTSHFFETDGISWSMLPVIAYNRTENYNALFFLPSLEDVEKYGQDCLGSPALGGSQITNLVFGKAGNTYTAYICKYYKNVTDANFTMLNIGEFSGSYKNFLQDWITRYYNGLIQDTQEGNVTVSPVQGVSDLATSVDETVVGANTLVDDDNGDVVVTGTPLADLQNIDIQALLQSLADNQITYEELLEALSLSAVNTETMTKSEIEALVDAKAMDIAGTNTITGNYTVSLKDLFPFCIPFDLYNIISAFNAEPVAPEVEITLPVSYNGSNFTWQDYTISLSDFDSVATVVRIFEYVLFIIGLMLITRKLIEG